MADNNSKEWKKSAEYSKQMAENLKDANRRADALKDGFSSIGAELFGISGAAFWKEVPKTTEEIRKQKEALKGVATEMEAANKALADGITKEFSAVSKKLGDALSPDLISDLGGDFSKIVSMAAEVGIDPDGIKSFQDVQNVFSKFKDDFKDNADKFDEYFDNQKDLQKLQKEVREKETKFLKEKEKHFEAAFTQQKGFLKFATEAEKSDIKRQLAGRSLNDAMKEQPKLAQQILTLSETQDKTLDDIAASANSLTGSYEDMSSELDKAGKRMFDLKGAALEFSKNFRQKAIGVLFEFDDAIHEAQKNTGIMFVENSDKMSELTQKTAMYGMSVEATTAMMSQLGDELATTDFGVLSEAASDLAAVQQATGAASEDITTIAGEMMRMGSSSADVKEAMEGANVQAKRFGVSTKKVMAQVSRNIDKMRTMGFQGGEQSLIRMAAMAEKLHIEVDAIFDVAKRARTIEGSMEMAAELQLAGGSFANINPMDLLAAARKGPDELGKILTSMGDDIGRFNEKTGEYEFDPIDTDRLQMVSDATEMSMDDLTKMITENAMSNQKLEMFPASMFEGEGMEGGQAFMEQMMQWDPEKKQFIATDELQALAEATGIDVSDLENLSQAELKSLMDEKAIKDENLEKQAQANMSLKESFNNFINSFMQVLTVFQPVLEALGTMFQWLANLLTGIPGWAKIAVAIFIAGFGVIGTSLVKKMLSGASKAVGKITDALMGGIKKGVSKIPGVGKLLGGKAEVPGADQADKMKDAAGKGSKGKGALTSIAKELKSAGKVGKKISLKGILNIAAAIGLMLLPLGAFAVIFAGTDPWLLVAAGFAIVELAGAFWIMSKISGSIDIKNVAKFALAAVIMSLALIPFAFAASIMGEVNWGNVLLGMLMLLGIIVIMMLIGAMMMGPQILFLLVGAAILLGVGLVMLAVGAMMSAASEYFGQAAENFNAFATVDWGGLMAAGPALMSLAAGMFAFALAGLLMFNPLMLLGMYIMFSALTALSTIMPPLADGLERAANSIDKVAEGIVKLNEASENISLEALSKLAAFGETMANLGSSEIKAVAEALYQISGGGGGGGGGGKGGSGGGGTKKIEIDLKLNGSQIQQIVDEWQETAS